MTPLDGSPCSLLNSNDEATEVFQHEDRTNTTSSVSSDEITALHASKHSTEPLAKESLYDNQCTNKMNVHEEHQASTPLTALSVCPAEIASDLKERTDESLPSSKPDVMESLKTTIDMDASKPPETITRPSPVPAPRTKKPTLNNSPPKVSSAKPTEAEKETDPSSGPAESSREDDKPLRPSSFRFNIASAKHRSKTSDENVTKQDEESCGNTQKGQAYSQNLVVQMEKVEDTKSAEVCRNTPSGPDKRSSLRREVIGHIASKTSVGDNPEKSQDRRGLFGVKLRSTSLSLRYCSELPKSEAELKRHSLESQHILQAAKEPVPSDVEAVGNDRIANVLTNPAPQSLDSPQDPNLDKGTFWHHFRE